MVFLQTSLIQIKAYHCNSLQNINMREYKDLKLDALINAIMEAQAELEKFNRSLVEEGNSKPLNFHGNIKMTNIFVEYCG